MCAAAKTQEWDRPALLVGWLWPAGIAERVWTVICHLFSNILWAATMPSHPLRRLWFLWSLADELNIQIINHTSCACSQSHLTLCDLMDCSLPGSSVHELFQARILEWIAISFSRGSSQPRDRICVSCVFCIHRQMLYHSHLGSPTTLQSNAYSQRTTDGTETQIIMFTLSNPFSLFHWYPSFSSSPHPFFIFIEWHVLVRHYLT